MGVSPVRITLQQFASCGRDARTTDARTTKVYHQLVQNCLRNLAVGMPS